MNDIFDIRGHNIILTGATGYFGNEFAHFLAKNGANLYLLSRSSDKLKLLVEEIEAYGGNYFPVSIDLSEKDDITKFCNSLEGVKINGLVNNAYSGGGGSFKLSKEEDFRGAFEITVMAAFSLSQGLLANFSLAVQLNEVASIINVGSMYGVLAPKFEIYENEKSYNPPFYGVAKAGLIHLTKYMATELGREGIRVNCLVPGPFPSPTAQKNKELIAGICQKSPMKRIGQSSELNGSVLYLLSQASSYTNGSSLVVDGGWTICS